MHKNKTCFSTLTTPKNPSKQTVIVPEIVQAQTEIMPLCSMKEGEKYTPVNATKKKPKTKQHINTEQCLHQTPLKMSE